MNISTLPTPQGQNQTTFTHAGIAEKRMGVHEIFAHHAIHSRLHPLFTYFDDEQGCLKQICYPEAYNAIRRAAKRVLEDHQPTGSIQPEVISILASLDSITYFTFIVGIMHNGLVPFPISLRNSPFAVAHLIRSTNASAVYVDQNSANHRLAVEASEILAKEGISLSILFAPKYEDLYCGTTMPDVALVKVDQDHPSLILHSSGSTNLPKPTWLTHRRFIQWGHVPYYGDLDLCGKVLAGHALPMCHSKGVIQIAFTSCSGLILGCFKPAYPPTVSSSDVFLDGIIRTNSNIVFCIPKHIETWAQSLENIPKLQNLDMIIYAGAPLNETVGQTLFKAGVKLGPFYGSTEMGTFSKFVDRKLDDSWQYFRISPHLDIKKVFREDAPDIFEPIVKATADYNPNVINTVIDGRQAYASSDYLQVHPTRNDLFRVFGRVDDQLILSTGENINPVPLGESKETCMWLRFNELEGMLSQDPNIVATVMFGHGRFQNGVIIQPAEPFDTDDEYQLSTFRNKIWPTVEKANEFASSFSRITKEMIIVTKESKPMDFTGKGTPRRQFVINAYAKEIDQLYETVGQSSQPNLIRPLVWNEETTLGFIRDVVKSVLTHARTDTENLFEQGCDSVKETWIRNTILHAVRSSTTVPAYSIPYSFVYSHPTIKKLSSFIFHKLQRAGIEDVDDNQVQVMEELVEKYSTFSLPSKGRNLEKKFSKTILLTGTTGFLGSHLLAQVLSDSSVHKVFALNRSGKDLKQSLMNRQKAAFKKWELDGNLLNEEKLVLRVGIVSEPFFGDKKLYDEMISTVTVVIHNAWLVDYKRKISAFEPLIAGVQNLLEFAYAANARFICVGSVGVAFGHPTRTLVEEELVPAETALTSGYTQSKWVSEMLISRARQEGVDASIVRVGRLCGDGKGVWNPREWAPSIVLAGKELGYLPSSDQELYWLPVDRAATALLEISKNATHNFLLYHLVAPRPVRWNSLFGSFARDLQVQLVSYSQWVDLLAKSMANSEMIEPKKLTAFHLLDFYRNLPFLDDPHLSTTHAVLASATLKELKPVSSADANRYLAYWLQTSELQPLKV